MKNLKKLPSKQLEKFSTIFTQLGLVLVLFVVYLTLEYQTEQKILAIKEYQNLDRIYIEADQNVIFKKEQITKPITAQKKVQKLILDDITKGDNSSEDEIIHKITDDIIPLNPDDIVQVKIPEEDPITETVDYIIIENGPVFKGCEGLSKEENKICFDKKMKEFVQRNFDAQIATAIGLRSGKYKIQTQFVIDNNGNVVDIQIRAPHAKLMKETQEMIEKLPKFTPGKQREKPVKVKYTLPISFQVD